MFVTSPRLRAHDTAGIVAAALGAPVVVDGRLGGGVTLEALEAVLADAGPAARPCVVGHEPDLSGLLADLLGGAAVEMRKGALALVDAPRPLVRGRGALRLLLPPDEVAGA